MSAETQGAQGLPDAPVDRPRKLPVLGIDHLELFVGNAQHTAAYLRSAFGFSLHAWQGPGTGVQDIVSLFVVAGDARLLLTSGLTPRHDAAIHALEHGDGVKDVAFSVAGMNDTYLGVKERGIDPLHLPVEMEDALGRAWICPVDGMGALIHTYIDRTEYDGWPAPGFVPVETEPREGVGISAVAAVGMVVQPGTLGVVRDRYERLIDPDRVIEVSAEETEEDGFSLTAVTLVRRNFMLRLVEPARRVRRSHLDDFLKLNGGPGVYSIVFRTDGLVRTVERLRQRGVRLLHAVPSERHAVTEPIQERAPIQFEFVESAEDPVPVDVLRAMHLAAERRYRHRADAPLLPREAAGR